MDDRTVTAHHDGVPCAMERRMGDALLYRLAESNTHKEKNRRNKTMTLGGKIALFLGGTLFGSAGFKLLSSADARRAYSHVTAAALRCKDDVMRAVEQVQDGCADILADAKQINARREEDAAAEYIEGEETAQ